MVLLGAIAAAGLLTGPDWTGPARVIGILAGIALLATGVLLAVRGVVDLRDALTPLPRPRHDAALVETGVYALARHPIYGGLVVASTGWALIQATWVGVLLSVVLAIVLTIKSMREEIWLVERFAAYPAYRARTRRFIPWIY